MNLFFILIIISSYCIGSISPAILICKLLHHPDPRYFGSKNPGTTNIVRMKKYNTAIIVLILDALKGAIPVWISLHYNTLLSPYSNAIAISVCLGHMYPIFFKFRGGKGVATAFGAITIMGIDLFVVMISTWMIIFLLFKYASSASIITAIMIPFYAWYFHIQYFSPIIIISCFIIIKHISNMQRLWNRKENSIFTTTKDK